MSRWVFPVVFASLWVAGAASAQSKCQQRCLDGDSCQQQCTDDRCMKRCSMRTQSCMEACEKTDPASTAGKKVKLTGTCPGPGGRMIPCDQIPQQQAPDEATVKKMVRGDNHPKTDKDREKEEASVPHTMPTADNWQQLLNEHQKKQQH